MDLELARADARRQTGRALLRRARPFGERRIDLRRPALRATAVAGDPPAADGEAVAGDPLRKPLARLVVGQGEHRARALDDHLATIEHLLGQLEQAEAVGDRRFRAADPFRDLAQRSASNSSTSAA